jgi:hypothetical protein
LGMDGVWGRKGIGQVGYTLRKCCLEPYPGGCPGGCPEAVWGYTLEPDVSRVWGIRHFRGYPRKCGIRVVRSPPKLVALCIPGIGLELGPPGALWDACPGAVRDAPGSVLGGCPGGSLGTSWGRPGGRPEVPSGRSGSAFRGRNWPFPAPEGRKRPFRPFWA